MKKPLILILVIAILAAVYVGMQKKDSSITTGEQAIGLIKAAYPAYQEYPSDMLPPKSVEVVETTEGWRVGMYVEGSGVPGILHADCFLVTKTGAVTETRFFNGEGPAKSINLSTCTPKE
jgi:hypothetical protein